MTADAIQGIRLDLAGAFAESRGKSFEASICSPAGRSSGNSSDKSPAVSVCKFDGKPFAKTLGTSRDGALVFERVAERKFNAGNGISTANNARIKKPAAVPSFLPKNGKFPESTIDLRAPVKTINPESKTRKTIKMLDL